jgi:hypothetical protein
MVEEPLSCATDGVLETYGPVHHSLNTRFLSIQKARFSAPPLPAFLTVDMTDASASRPRSGAISARSEELARDCDEGVDQRRGVRVEPDESVLDPWHGLFE